MCSISGCSSSSPSYDNADVLSEAEEKLESLNLYNMPVECLDGIASFLDLGSILALAKTCRRIHDILRSLYAGQIRKLTERACASYGALANCERETNNPQKLMLTTSATLRLHPQLPLTLSHGRELLVQFDSDGVPSLLKYDELIQSDPKVERFGGRGSFYRGDYLRQIHKEMITRFQQFEKIYDEFLSQDLNPKRPLQDLRNRNLRIMTIEKELAILQLTWRQATLFHRRYSKEMSFIKRKIQGAKWLMGYDSKIPHVNFNFKGYERVLSKFCMDKSAPLGHKIIQLEGYEVPVMISVRVSGKVLQRPMFKELEGSTSVFVSFQNKNVATCEFTKVWESKGRIICETDTLETERVTKENRAYIQMNVQVIPANANHLEVKHFAAELRENLIDQLAAEVLLREDFPALHIQVFETQYIGFSVSRKTVLTLHKNDSSPESSSSTEKFSRIRDENGNVALVPSEKEPTTWEEYFARHGYLLGDSTEPVLPKFITKDFEKPVVAATPTCSSR